MLPLGNFSVFIHHFQFFVLHHVFWPRHFPPSSLSETHDEFRRTRDVEGGGRRIKQCVEAFIEKIIVLNWVVDFTQYPVNFFTMRKLTGRASQLQN